MRGGSTLQNRRGCFNSFRTGEDALILLVKISCVSELWGSWPIELQNPLGISEVEPPKNLNDNEGIDVGKLTQDGQSIEYDWGGQLIRE